MTTTAAGTLLVWTASSWIRCCWTSAQEDGARRSSTTESCSRRWVSRARVGALSSTSSRETAIPVTRETLVIGGGVAGIQSALDLAQAGYQVHLVEKEPTIGGIMAQIDKTYPTMDCLI